MRFLLDENIDVRLAADLAAAGHDVTAVARDYQHSLSDRDILSIAHAEGRVLITKDRDFGELIFREHLPHAGVVYLRMRGNFSTQRKRLAAVIRDHAEQLHQFLVVTATTVRPR